MSTFSTELVWGPMLIGLMFALGLYGVEVGQFVYYMQAFPRDKLQLKALVLAVFVVDSALTVEVVWFQHRILIDCRSNASPECVTDIPPFTFFGVSMVFWITFVVQSFYAHRVWIISGRNRVITSAVLLFASTQLVIGSLVTIELIRTSTYQVLLTSQVLLLGAVLSAICDALITVSIFYYLRPARTGVTRRNDYIWKLNVVFIQMGLFSFINTSAVGIMYCIQDNGTARFLSAAPGTIISKTFANSMLSVLNARKGIREEQQARAQRTIDIPTVPTIR